MLKKLAGYLFVSLLSFGFFTACFHAAAHAQGSSGILAPLLAKTEPAKPTPPPPILIGMKEKPPTTPPPTDTPTPTATPTPQPTDTPTPTPTALPTETPTPSPTDTPTPIQSEPTPTPTTAPATQPTGSDLDLWFTKYADEYHVDRELLRNIARCESGFNTNSDTNPPYVGMYQFEPTTWSSTRASMGLDTNPDLRRNAEESIKTAAYKISHGGQSAWPPPTCQ